LYPILNLQEKYFIIWNTLTAYLCSIAKKGKPTSDLESDNDIGPALLIAPMGGIEYGPPALPVTAQVMICMK
jgi:hypothetical protein